MTSFGSLVAVVFVDAPAWNDCESPPASMRFGAEAEGGSAAFEPGNPRTERLLSSSALYRPKMSSMILLLTSLAASAALFAVGVFAREVPRFLAFPNGPFSSGMRR